MSDQAQGNGQRPQRVQLRRTKGWRKPEGAIVVSRPSKWGNPFTIHHEGSHALAVAAFRSMVAWSSDHGVRCGWLNGQFTSYPTDAEIRDELAGHDLACWCPPGKACHADVLLEIANA